MKKKRAAKKKPLPERDRIIVYLRSAGFDEAATVVSLMKSGEECDREGYWMRDIEGVMRCDSGYYEEDEDGILRCTCCGLIGT